MKTLFAAALVALPLTACVTPSGTKKQKPVATKPAQDKAGTKEGPATAAATPPQTTTPGATGQEPGTTVGQTPPASAEPAPLPPPSDAEMLRFVRVNASPTSDFTARDHEFVSALPSNPEHGGIAEAALVLGLVRSVLHPLTGGAATFQEADITTGGAARTVKSRTPTLEQLCKDREVNLVDALIENPLLASHGVARQTLEALKLEGATPEFRAEVTVALRNQVAFWSQIGQEMGAADAPQTAATDAPPPADSVDAPPPNPADLRGGDSALTEAQSLADRGDYRSAIKKASTIPAGSPMHPTALEKIRDFSNLAVQELRSKAAQAFQSAMPVTDRKTRAAYLQQAKTYLEEAITNYPQASTLPTVRDNLRVISRDLEKLQTEGATQGH